MKVGDNSAQSAQAWSLGEAYELSLPAGIELSIQPHDQWDLLYLESGEDSLQLGRSPTHRVRRISLGDPGEADSWHLVTETLQAGQALWIPPHYAYLSFQDLGQAMKPRRWWRFRFQAPTRREGLDWLMEEPVKGAEETLQACLFSPLYQCFEVRPQLRALLNCLLQMEGVTSPLVADTACAQQRGPIQGWLVEAVIDAVASQLHADKPIHPAVSEALTYIQQHFCQPLTIEEIARQVAIHPAYLQRIFSQSLGMPMMQWVNRLRMQKGVWLLRDTEATILEIAKALGFNSRQTFHAAFLGYYKISPQKYRRLLREAVLE